MALATNSYGDTGEIAALVPKFANTSGIFDTTTRPTLLQVESETDQVSAAVNMVLSEEGFSIPVTDTDAKLMLDGFVNKMVAEIVLGINGYGRFGPTGDKREGSRGKYLMIMEDVEAFVGKHAVGMERLGATRTYSLLDSVAYRDTDQSGDETHPIFQREAFGEVYTNYDED